MERLILKHIVKQKHADLRLDKVLVELFSEFSRSFLQGALKKGYILVNGKPARPSYIVHGGEEIIFEVQENINTDEMVFQPENIPLNIVYVDESLIIVDKIAGMVVHPAAGHATHTLVNALIYHYPDLAAMPRAGIIHRLDKDTSGLLIVVRNQPARKILVEAMQSRQIEREYLCLVKGKVISGSSVSAAIGRHPRDRKRMAVMINGKEAITHYRIEQRFKHHTLLRVKLETGRTHQIRVHMAHIHFPVFGDPVYGGRTPVPANAHKDLLDKLLAFNRQALHACHLSLVHPLSSRLCTWKSHLPEDMHALLETLKQYD